MPGEIQKSSRQPAGDTSGREDGGGRCPVRPWLLTIRYLCRLEGAMGTEPRGGRWAVLGSHPGAHSAGDRAQGTCLDGASMAGTLSMPAAAGKNH